MATQRSKSYIQDTMLPDIKSPLNCDVPGNVTKAELRDLAESVVFKDGSSGSGGVGATQAEVDRVADVSARIVNATAATLTVTLADHDSKTIVLDRAAGITATLPAATGSGCRLRFIVKTTVTSNNHVIQVVGNDTMTGLAQLAQDSADTVVVFETASDSDTITMNGSTKGGIKGDLVELEDIAADLWYVRVLGSATGTEATPFSAAVS